MILERSSGDNSTTAASSRAASISSIWMLIDGLSLKRYAVAVSKATLYLDDDLHRALRLKAAETRESMSGLVNEALRVLLAEDLEDISDWQQRRSERAVTYEEFLKQLAADGTI